MPVTVDTRDALMYKLLIPEGDEINIELERSNNPWYWYECPYCSFKNDLSEERTLSLKKYLTVVCSMCNKTSRWDRMIHNIYY